MNRFLVAGQVGPQHGERGRLRFEQRAAFVQLLIPAIDLGLKFIEPFALGAHAGLLRVREEDRLLPLQARPLEEVVPSPQNCARGSLFWKLVSSASAAP